MCLQGPTLPSHNPTPSPLASWVRYLYACYWICTWKWGLFFLDFVICMWLEVSLTRRAFGPSPSASLIRHFHALLRNLSPKKNHSQRFAMFLFHAPKFGRKSSCQLEGVFQHFKVIGICSFFFFFFFKIFFPIFLKNDDLNVSHRFCLFLQNLGKTLSSMKGSFQALKNVGVCSIFFFQIFPNF